MIKLEIKPSLGRVLNILGTILIVLSITVLTITFFPVAKEEVKYGVDKVVGIKYSVEPSSDKKVKELKAPNTLFSILIPKIGASAPVFANIDSQKPAEFLPILKKGVAHAKGTQLPGQEGNVYLFAHSTDSFYNVGNYNAVFYLLGKLSKGDEIDIYYQNQRYIYDVQEVKVVGKEVTKYLGNYTSGNTLTLQTCYPPGTSLKRLIVTATQVN